MGKFQCCESSGFSQECFKADAANVQKGAIRAKHLLIPQKSETKAIPIKLSKVFKGLVPIELVCLLLNVKLSTL